MGDGIADDTASLQKAINAAFLSGQIVFVDAGTCGVTNMLYVPRNSKLGGKRHLFPPFNPASTQQYLTKVDLLCPQTHPT